MGAEVLKKFGRYFLLDQIAQGGMAEIYRSRLAAQDGAGRILVIKRIQAGFGGNNEFYQMFKSEIKVTMGFNHPNIIQIYDFGDEENQPFIAMEWVDGRNLRQFLSRFAELKQTFPIDLAAYVIEQSASGLHYAHAFKDKITGEALAIVHRDISPQNILIAYEGTVKVIDFGIAKANSNMEATRAGVIKGKPSYLSPEQIAGEVLDGRSDLFALGIVLWELLTGRKLFAGESDLAVLKLIESCNSHVKPPSTFNPKIPKELDYIVLKCLAKQREKRYQSCEELQRALHKFLYAFAPDFNPGDLAYYAKDLFKNEIVEDRKLIQKLNDKVEVLLAQELLSPVASGFGQGAGAQQRGPTQITVLELDKTTRQEKVQIEAPKVAPPRPAVPSQSSANRPQPARSTSTVSRNSSRSVTDLSARAPQSKGQSSFMSKLLVAAAMIVGVAIVGPGYGISVPVISPMFSGVTKSLMGSSGAELVLDGNASNLLVSINGKLVANRLPYTIGDMPVGSPFQVVVESPTGKFEREFTLRKGEKKTVPIVFLDRASGGSGGNANSSGSEDTGSQTAQSVIDTIEAGKAVLMRLTILPSSRGAQLSINGRTLNPENPWIWVPLNSAIELNVEKSGFKPYRREFSLDQASLKGSKEWPLEVALEPSRFGYLSIRTTPSADAIILIDGQPMVRKTPLQDEKLPVGTYNIRLVNEVLGMEKTVSVVIQEGKYVNVDERLGVRSLSSE